MLCLVRGVNIFTYLALSQKESLLTQIPPFHLIPSSRRCVHPGTEDHVRIWVNGVLPHLGLQVRCPFTHPVNALYQRTLSTHLINANIHYNTITKSILPQPLLSFLERVSTAK